MPTLSQITPTQKLRLMDLAQAAGVNVSDWANFQGGKRYAARNPKYCYEWSFVDPGTVVVLNIWHHAMTEEKGGIVTRDMNMREFAHQRPEPERTRGLKMDDAIRTAIEDELPIRVIVLDGKRRGDPDGPSTGPSYVTKRLLDPESWAVTSYDYNTGQCTLTRGAQKHAVSQQLTDYPDVDADAMSVTEGRKQWREHFNRERNRQIVDAKKKQVLAVEGKLVCEACGFNFTEFYRPHAEHFCEVHHLKPIATLQGGEKTRLKDLAILCSNCHRVIHLIKPMPTVHDFSRILRGRKA